MNKDCLKDRKTHPLSIWREKDRLGGKTVDVLVMILNGPGCTHARSAPCTMCGYGNDVSSREVSIEDLTSQTEDAIRHYGGEPYVKIFTSGSFLDDAEIPSSLRELLIGGLHDLNPASTILFETRPEYVDERKIHALRKVHDILEIALGLETSSDLIRDRIIRKGFTWNDYLNAGRTIVNNGVALKTYLLLKPPLLSEREAIQDAIDSIKKISSMFPGSKVSVNPMNIQSRTLVEKLYQKGLYKPPWLWSVSLVLKKGFEVSGGNIHLMSHPTAGGKARGAHNCGKCDQDVLDSIREFSLNNRENGFIEGSECCYDLWKESNDLCDLFCLMKDIKDPR